MSWTLRSDATATRPWELDMLDSSLATFAQGVDHRGPWFSWTISGPELVEPVEIDALTGVVRVRRRARFP